MVRWPLDKFNKGRRVGSAASEPLGRLGELENSPSHRGWMDGWMDPTQEGQNPISGHILAHILGHATCVT